MTSNSLIYLGGKDTLQCQDGVLIQRGVGLTMAQLTHAGGKVVTRVLNTGYSGPNDPKNHIHDFFSEAEKRERTLDELHKANLDNLTKQHKQLLKQCHNLLKYAHPECTVKTQLITFKILVTLITRYPGIRCLFLHDPKRSKNATPPAASHFENLWNRPHQQCGEEWAFYRDFAVYCLIDSCLTKLVESELPSKFGQLKSLEHNLNKDPIEILLSYCSADSPFNHEKLSAIRYLAAILELPKFWRLKTEEGIEVGKRLFDFLSHLCEVIIQLIQDTEPSSDDDPSPLWSSACLAVDILALATFGGFLRLHGLDDELPPCPSPLSSLVFLLMRPKMETIFPKAFRCAPQVEEILNWPKNAETNSLHEAQSDLILEGILRENCALDALVDAGERHTALRATRHRVLTRIYNWADGDGSRSGIFWVYGGAGVGKSTLAQTLAEEFKESGELMASFFFNRSTFTRSNGNRLIPTLVFQLFKAIPGIQPLIHDKIRNDPTLFTKTRETQMKALFIEPLLSYSRANPTHVHPPLLIVIDGLDECQNPDIQCDLLRILAEAIPQLPYPFRILITSRPEAHIVQIFDHEKAFDEIRNSVHRYDLNHDDTDSDIRLYMEQEFQNIRQTHPRSALLQDWPDQADVDTLVERSSGLFIYASTALSYIKLTNHDPKDRLRNLLSPKKPLPQLDSLIESDQDFELNNVIG